MNRRIRRLGIVVPALLNLFFLSPGAEAAGRQQLHGHVPKALATALWAGPMEGSRRLDIVLQLPFRDSKGLQEFLGQLRDPKSPQYRHFLTQEQFTQKYGPSESDYQSLLSFARSNNLFSLESSSDHRMLEVQGSAADVQKAFHVVLNNYRRRDGSLFYAPQNEPSVDLETPILHISGLDDEEVPKPLVHAGRPLVFNGGRNPHASAIAPSAASNAGSAPSGLYWGPDFRNAYVSGSCLTGKGQSVALVEFEGYYATDIQGYESLTGIANVPLTNVLVGGFSGIPPTGRRADPDGVLEVSLDIEMAVAMSPGLSQVRVYEVSENASNATADMMLQKIATDDISKQISCSWTGFGDSGTPAIFQQYEAQGQAFFQAAGDDGAYVTGDPETVVPSPINESSQIDMTVVGGTELTLNATDYQSETTWNAPLDTDSGLATFGGGGGVCSLVPIPSYQQSVNMAANGGSSVSRNIPDVSMVADNIFVVADKSYISNANYSYYTVVGTSAAAPLWAGFLALANQQGAGGGVTIGFANPALYAIGQGGHYGTDFNDINDGSTNNLAGNSSLYAAVNGYDLATGWGSPKGIQLINDLTGLSTFPCPPTSTFTSTPTSTFTSTPTRTPTSSPTPTATFSRTSTKTQTPTATPSMTPTLTSTFSSTSTKTFSPTPTSTKTLTPTPSFTETFTGTSTPTLTSTPTITFTGTPTSTATETSTPSFSPTLTSTKTLTPTPSFTETFTGTSTPTLTSTPTITFTGTPTSTATETSTPSFSPTPTPSETFTETPTITSTDTPSDTPSTTFTPTWTNTPTQTSTDSFTSTITETPLFSYTPTETPTETDSATSTSTSTMTLTSTPSGTFTATPTATATPSRTATPMALPPFTVSVQPNFSRNGEAIQWKIESSKAVGGTLKIYDLAGELVYRANVEEPAGFSSVAWTLENQDIEKVSSGLYIYQLNLFSGSSILNKNGYLIVLR